MRTVQHPMMVRDWVLRLALACVFVAAGVRGASADGMLAEGQPWAPYRLERALSYGPYLASVWISLDDAAPSYHRVVALSRDGQLLACHDGATGLGALSGTDIDGSGWPNVIIETYSGGAHCCLATYVYDLADTLVAVELPPSPGGNSGGEFADLNGDGVFEYLTADDSFAYTYCAFAGSPAVRVVLAYDARERRYVPASFRYPELYALDIERDIERARAVCSGAGDLGWDGTPKCEVLPLVLDYLYSGVADSAWAALETYYIETDQVAFRAEIERVIRASPYYPGAR